MSLVILNHWKHDLDLRTVSKLKGNNGHHTFGVGGVHLAKVAAVRRRDVRVRQHCERKKKERAAAAERRRSRRQKINAIVKRGKIDRNRGEEE